MPVVTILASGSTDEYSAPFRLNAGEHARVTAFGLEGQDKAHIQVMNTDTGEYETADQSKPLAAYHTSRLIAWAGDYRVFVPNRKADVSIQTDTG